MGAAFREFNSMTGTWANWVASLRSWGSRVRGEAELRKRKAAKLPARMAGLHPADIDNEQDIDERQIAEIPGPPNNLSTPVERLV
jgi:hypothetical protein